MNIRERVQRVISEVPDGVTVVAASKTRTPEEILEAIDGGIKVIGENYVQEAEEKFRIVGGRVDWHMLGHLQRNKAGKALQVFDMVETVDSVKLAGIIDRIAASEGRIYPVLIEINSCKEEQKSGVFPEDAEQFILGLEGLDNLEIQGVMTMGPFVEDPEEIRPFFKITKEVFNKLKNMNGKNINMKYLSMGMSNSWRIAIEEGANIVRLGNVLFGPRKG